MPRPKGSKNKAPRSDKGTTREKKPAVKAAAPVPEAGGAVAGDVDHPEGVSNVVPPSIPVIPPIPVMGDDPRPPATTTPICALGGEHDPLTTENGGTICIKCASVLLEPGAEKPEEEMVTACGKCGMDKFRLVAPENPGDPVLEMCRNCYAIRDPAQQEDPDDGDRESDRDNGPHHQTVAESPEAVEGALPGGPTGEPESPEQAGLDDQGPGAAPDRPDEPEAGSTGQEAGPENIGADQSTDPEGASGPEEEAEWKKQQTTLSKNGSIVSYPKRGDYGDNKYRGNTTGLLIKDLLEHYRPTFVFDPMDGGKTTRDVCEELWITYYGLDLADDHDSGCIFCSPYYGQFKADLIFWHPPYFDMVKYADQEPKECNLSAFTSSPRGVKGYTAKAEMAFLRLAHEVLTDNGVMICQVGDARKGGRYTSMLPMFLRFGEHAGLVLESLLVKVQHNTKSKAWMYKASEGKPPFIPIYHEWVVCWRKPMVEVKT